MNDDEYKRLVIAHDKDLQALTHNTNSLTISIQSIGSKIEDLVDVISQQSVLAEKIMHIDKNTKEAFERRDKQIEYLIEVDKKHIPPWLLKIVVALVITQAILFGTFVVSELHRLSNLTGKEIQMQRQINTSNAKEFERLNKSYEKVRNKIFGG
ncbi:MAG: hypothetical protein U9N33_08120 [Campylobacterota bacterium]|nr:hypothetical protein [Campylobacterota bacterium]